MRRLILAPVFALVGILGVVVGPIVSEAVIPPGVTVTYTKTVTAQPAPAADFQGAGSGDGWALGFSATRVFNIFHHADTLQVSCHVKSTAALCPVSDGYDANGVKVVTDAGSNFLTSGMPSIWSDQASNKLYVYATLASNAGSDVANTAGVVCLDAASSSSDPFCGFTALSGQGEAPPMTRDNPAHPSSQVTNAVEIDHKWYSFNYVEGTPSGTQDQLMCYDLVTKAACASQPYAVNFGLSSVEWMAYPIAPGPGITSNGGEILIPVASSTSTGNYACYSTTTGPCGGSFPLSAPAGVSFGATAIPILDTTGSASGFCLPGASADTCLDLTGALTSTPPGFDAAIPGSLGKGYLAPGVVSGSKVFVPLVDYINVPGAGSVGCYDFLAEAGCTHFPKALSGAAYPYTVNIDASLPACLWAVSDSGSSQIQNFASSGNGPCGAEGVPVPLADLIVQDPVCEDASLLNATVTSPARSTYQSGQINFLASDGTLAPNLAPIQLDANGAADLSAAGLTALSDFRLFGVALTGAPADPVSLKLAWTGPYNVVCTSDGAVADYSPTSSTTTPAGTLPMTGANLSGPLTLGAFLFIGGFCALAMRWSRRRSLAKD